MLSVLAKHLRSANCAARPFGVPQDDKYERVALVKQLRKSCHLLTPSCRRPRLIASSRCGAVSSKMASHMARSASVNCIFRRLMAVVAVSYSFDRPKPLVTMPSRSQENSGMYFVRGLPVAMISDIAPTYAPLLNRVPIDVLV